jgi:hypothetical protein
MGRRDEGAESVSIQCYCDVGGGEYADAWLISYHVARKAHRCIECQDEIKPGERYQRTFMVADGVGSTHKTCAFCAAEWDRLMAKPYPEAPEMCVPGDLACYVLMEVRDAA